MQTVIETKALCKQYGSRMAVDHVELHGACMGSSGRTVRANPPP